MITKSKKNEMNFCKIFGIKNRGWFEKQNSSKNPMIFEEGLKTTDAAKI